MAARHTSHDTRRTYADGCAGAHALDLVGERWALLVVRELLFGPKRFTDLRSGLPGISPNVLSHRLQKLETYAVVTRRRLPPPARAWVYELTEWGKELEQVIMDLGRWGARSPYRDCTAELGPDSLMLALRTLFAPRAGQDLHARLAVHFDQDRFRVEIAGNRLEIERGEADDADATLETDPATLSAVVYGSRELDEVTRAAELVVRGDRSVVSCFLAHFSLPEQAAKE